MPDEKRFPKLVEGNYESWRCLMEATIVAADLWEVVGPEDPDLVYKGAKGAKEKMKKMQQARGKIVLELDPSQLPFVVGLEDPREIWGTLEIVHRSASVNSILSLRRRFFRMTKIETESTMSWISRVRGRAFELSNTPCPVTDIDIIFVITDGLPQKYETVVSALDGLPFHEINISNVVARIMGHEAHINRMVEKESDELGSEALIAAVKRGGAGNGQQGVTCFNCGGKGHIRSNCPSAGGSDFVGVIADDEDLFAF